MVAERAHSDEVRDEALADLRRLVGGDADFRPGQLEAIQALVVNRGRALVVQRTGWGKSAVYFVATAMLRRRESGPTILISPLLALMRNQIAAAERAGIRAATINSDNKELWDEIEDSLQLDQIDILLIAPERFANARFRTDVLPAIAQRVGLLVIDEVHCISDWGHDFRPDYRRISRVLELMPRGVPVLGTTATANNRVINDVSSQLGDGLVVQRDTLDRASLVLDVVQLPSQAERLAWLAEAIPRLQGSGIVYTLTVADAQRVAEWLRLRGIDARAYAGETETADKLEIEADLIADRLKVVVATSALGMGYDKPNLAFVIHYQTPGSAIAYYQQVGRAGRALDRAYGIALSGTEDRAIQDFFISTAFPSRERAEEVIRIYEDAADFVQLAEIERSVNVRRTRLLAMMKILEVEGALEKGSGYSWRRTLRPWAYDEERYEAVTAERRREQDAMHDYLTGSECLMLRLREELDDPTAQRCGRCSRCVEAAFVIEPNPSLVAEARAFLRGQIITVEPRKMGVPTGQRLEIGRALSLYGDGEWGSVVKQAKIDEHYPDELVEALAAMFRSWSPEPEPTWVTCVPSLRAPLLVRSLTARLAERLHLPFDDIVSKDRETEPQNVMENGPQQEANVTDAFSLRSDPRPGPVLLVDDIVDSRWTLTAVGRILRQGGSGPVIPLTLASAYGG